MKPVYQQVTKPKTVKPAGTPDLGYIQSQIFVDSLLLEHTAYNFF